MSGRAHGTDRSVLFLLLALTALIGGAVPASGQETRAGLIADQQRQKAERLAPEQSPAGEVLVTRIMRSPLLTGTGSVYPWFGSIYNGAGFGLGAGYLRQIPGAGRFNTTAAFTLNRSTAVSAELRVPGVGSTVRVQPTIDGRWSRLRGLTFDGVGPATVAADRIRFDYDFREVNLGVAVVAPFLTITGSYGYLGLSTSVDPLAPPVPGADDSTDYQVSHAGAILDWRPSPRYSTRGGFARIAWQGYNARRSVTYSFNELEVEAGHLVPFVREQFGLAFRALATTTFTDPGRQVPFVLLPSVGGGDTVRGLANRRFHDRSRVVLTAEYLWRPSRYLDMALFVDSGAVAPRLRDMRRHTLQTSYGIGARIHGPAFTALRVEAARGSEGWQLVFTTGQAF